MKKLRILACEFDKIKTFIVIPFINLAFMHIVRYFEFEDYGKYNHPKKEVKNYDVKNKYILFFAGRVFRSYDSKYLKVLNNDKPLYDRGTFNSLDLTEEEIKAMVITGNVGFVAKFAPKTYSYTVKYLDKDTNEEIADMFNKTFALDMDEEESGQAI